MQDILKSDERKQRDQVSCMTRREVRTTRVKEEVERDEEKSHFSPFSSLRRAGADRVHPIPTCCPTHMPKPKSSPLPARVAPFFLYFYPLCIIVLLQLLVATPRGTSAIELTGPSPNFPPPRFLPPLNLFILTEPDSSPCSHMQTIGYWLLSRHQKTLSSCFRATKQSCPLSTLYHPYIPCAPWNVLIACALVTISIPSRCDHSLVPCILRLAFRRRMDLLSYTQTHLA